MVHTSHIATARTILLSDLNSLLSYSIIRFYILLLFGLCDRKYVNADLSNILKINFLLMLKLAFPFHLKTSSHFRILSMLLVSLSLFVFTYKYERDPRPHYIVLPYLWIALNISTLWVKKNETLDTQSFKVIHLWILQLDWPKSNKLCAGLPFVPPYFNPLRRE